MSDWFNIYMYGVEREDNVRILGLVNFDDSVWKINQMIQL